MRLRLQHRLACRAALRPAHIVKTDAYRPHIRACFGNHQHTQHRNPFRKEHNRNIKCKAEHNGQPHMAERFISLFSRFLIKQHNHPCSHRGKRNVAHNPPSSKGALRLSIHFGGKGTAPSVQRPADTWRLWCPALPPCRNEAATHDRAEFKTPSL